MKISGMKMWLAAVFAVAASPAPRHVPPDFGVYLGWVGTHPGNRLAKGARLAREFGFETIRMPLVPSFETDFGIGSACHSGQPLADLLSLPAYASVAGDPAFHTVFLTVWGDANSDGACEARDPRTDQHPHKRYLDLEFYSMEANRRKMREDYAGLAYRLFKDYRGTGKVFGISNWEGDNELYCDAAALYALNASFRATCDAKRKTGDAVAAYRQFLTLRHEGIEAGKERARRERLTGVAVREVIEISSFRLLKDRQLPSVLYDLIPAVAEPDYVSYSAWESLGNPDQLARDLRELQTRFHARLIAGEFGFDRGLDPSAADHAAAALGAMRKAQVPFAVWWQIFDQPPLSGLGDKGQYGLYDDKGRLTTVGSRFLSLP